MIKSMTGFSSGESTLDGLRVGWELRSVNHRYLDLSMRLPEDLRSLEPACRECIGDVVKRGKVDASLRLQRQEGSGPGQHLNPSSLARLLDLVGEVKLRAPDVGPIGVAEILRWPGVLEDDAIDQTRLRETVLGVLRDTADGLGEARSREGGRIGALLGERCDQIEAGLASLRPTLGASAARYRAKLLERLERLDVQADPTRLEQELVHVAQRLDVEEELDRIDGHVEEVRAALNKAEPVGRRLDFLIQELNREANTLASKSADDAMTRVAVELKVVIEQMREQVQNVE